LIQHAAQLDDFGSLPVCQPASTAALCDLVYRAAADYQALYPLGGRTMLGYGLPPARNGIAVHMLRLDQVIDYPARDMTITVQAGITIAKLQEVLAAENQRLPIDVPQAEKATLGGAIATNTSGPRRYGCGTLRDYVIGISVVNDEGQEVKAGGRVVKNVAGYDFCKLHVGALGTLGIITQVTLKLKPRPEEHALIALGCAAASVEPLLELLCGSRTRPVCLELLNQAAAQNVSQQIDKPLPEAPWVLVVGFEDNREATAWQVQQLIKELPAASYTAMDARVGSASVPLWTALVEFAGLADGQLTFKANLLPRATAAFCQRAAEQPENLQLQAHAGNGIVIGHTGKDITLEQARALLRILHASAAEVQGNVVLLRCPREWKRELPVWGKPHADLWLMRAVKDKLDPRRLFNPGRFVDGL
jgi:glycolate oxidase FAD binding subunit